MANLNPRPIIKKKLSEIVEEELELMIRQEEFEEGQKLPSERELMTLFDVGRPSIREALSALSRKGLVKITSGERAKVIRPSADSVISELSGLAKHFLTNKDGVKHFEQLRQFYESSLVRYAAEFATPAQIIELEAALNENAQSLNSPRAFQATDILLHRVIAKIPGNPIFLAIHEAMVEWLIKERHEVNNPLELAKTSFNHHVKIVEAIKNKDPIKADAALRSHLDNVYEVYYSSDS